MDLAAPTERHRPLAWPETEDPMAQRSATMDLAAPTARRHHRDWTATEDPMMFAQV